MKSVVTFIIPDDYGTLFAKYVGGVFAIIPVCIAFMVIIMSVAGAKFSFVWLSVSILISIGCLVISYLMFKYILGDTHKIIINLSSNTLTKEIGKKPERENGVKSLSLTHYGWFDKRTL